MSNKLQPVRGTHDILPEEFEKFHAVVTLARELATLYGFREMATPIFENTDVFSRSMGETSDVVAKEMFTFQTKGEESVTLRPEFTAGIVRAFLSNGMQQHLPLKLFSTGPLFRYERPQKGRQRQFHQVNFEWLGDGSPEADVEIILLAGHLLHSIAGRESSKLLINTLGDETSRVRYREALINYLTPYKDDLSEDSQRRLTTNPLRILDSKSEQDKKITTGAPKIHAYLSDASKQRFETVKQLLEQCKKENLFAQKIIDDPSLVRGLDYYNDVVFEFISDMGEIGAQNTVLAGGRYDGLTEQMGGKPMPAIGFAAGVERLRLLGEIPLSKAIKIFVMPYERQASESVFFISEMLRTQLHAIILKWNLSLPIAVEIFWQGDLKKRLERADKRDATHAVIMSQNAIAIKNMSSREQHPVSMSDFADQDKLAVLFDIVKLDPGLRRDDKA